MTPDRAPPDPSGVPASTGSSSADSPSGDSSPGERRDPILTVERLSAAYRTDDGPLPAVRNVSLEVYPGEVLALVGESASGKSSVAHSILGLLPSNATVEGEIRFQGRSLLALDDEELQRIRGEEIAMIFQDAHAALTPSITIGEQLAELFRAHRSMTEGDAEQAAVQALRGVLPDAEWAAQSYPFQISGGMAQRVMIAMATALEPALIIADEPTASLDAPVRMDTLQRLEALRDQSDASILLITHDFGVVARLADRVGVMYAGELVETADVRTIFRHPRHPYTYGLLQSLPGLADTGRLTPMRGQPPDLTELPDECPFLPRCPKAVSKCRFGPAPPLAPVEDAPEGQRVACYNPIVVPLRD